MDGTIRVYNCDKRHSNEYLLVKNEPEKYRLRSIKSNRVRIVSPHTFLSLAQDFDVVILHTFICLKYYYISKIPQNCKVVLYAWGFDIYGDSYPIVPIKLYDEETKKYKDSCHLPKGLKNKVSILSTRLRNSVDRLFRKQALSRIDYFSGVFPYEYDLVKSYHRYFNAKPIDFYYGDTDFFIKDTVNTDIERGKVNIIIGNSAAMTNNHHDALTAISNVNLPPSAKIIIPLSYAGSPEYIQWVTDYAESLFPGHVNALKDYMPLQDYLDLTSHCKVAIFFHERQQASDNIFMQMMYGAKVYMSETSLAYKYLKEEGFVVFSLQSEADKLFDDMTDEMIMTNRRLLCEKYSDHTIIDRVRLINQQIEAEIKNN
jgi:hypothetical protein